MNRYLPKEYELIYGVMFGSKLYGTNSEKSDTDYKGIFLPSREDIILGNVTHSFHSPQSKEKNTSADVDVDLWSVYKFINLLKLGDINALDMLFSYTHTECIMKSSDFFENIYAHRDLFITKQALSKGHMGYIFTQLKKYLIKGSNLFVINFVFDYFKDKPVHDTIEQYIPELISVYKSNVAKIAYDEKGRRNEEKIQVVDHTHASGKTEKLLELNFDKKFPLNQRVKMLLAQLQAWKDKYGNRTIESLDNSCVDNKAVSHALRSLIQVNELIDTGSITFPLSRADEIKRIKYEPYNYKEVLEYIEDETNKLLSKIETLNIPEENNARIDELMYRKLRMHII